MFGPPQFLNFSFLKRNEVTDYYENMRILKSYIITFQLQLSLHSLLLSFVTTLNFIPQNFGFLCYSSKSSSFNLRVSSSRLFTLVIFLYLVKFLNLCVSSKVCVSKFFQWLHFRTKKLHFLVNFSVFLVLFLGFQTTFAFHPRYVF